MQRKSVDKSTKYESAAGTSAGAGLFHLNDDCLLEIFKYLDLAAQVRLVLVCTRLRGFFQLYSLHQRKALQQRELATMSEMEIKLFFEMSGVYLEELNNIPNAMHKCSDWMLVTVNEFCPNVRKFCFSVVKLPTKCLRKLLCNMKQLISLDLRDCSLDAQAMRYVSELTQLQCLKLEGMENVTGQHLYKLCNLKELVLISCGIRDKYFMEACKCLKQLKTLSLLWCYSITESAICAMPKNCLQLEVLRISCSYSIQYYALADLPRLIDLELNIAVLHTFFTRQLLLALGARRGNQLECLRINCAALDVDAGEFPLSNLQKLRSFICEDIAYLADDCLDELAQLEHLEMLDLRGCQSLYDEAVLTILENCHKIKHINLMNCPQISEQLVQDVVELLEQRQQELQQVEEGKHCLVQPLLMLVAGTNIKESILKDSRYLAAKSLIRLSFSY